MKLKKWVLSVVLLVILVLSTAIAPEAASKNSKALKAYKPIVESKRYSGMNITAFGLADINKDGVKELFIRDGNNCSLWICGYKNGKVVKLFKDTEMNFYFPTYYNKKTGYVILDESCCGSHQYYTALKISKNMKVSKVKLASFWVDVDEGLDPGMIVNKNDFAFTVKGKYVSEKKYNKEKSKIEGKKKNRSKIKFYNNSKKNRSKYLK